MRCNNWEDAFWSNIHFPLRIIISSLLQIQHLLLIDTQDAHLEKKIEYCNTRQDDL